MALHERHSAQGFEVLAFPCNQFGGQEPGSAAEIVNFAESKYGAKFDMFEKVDVNGPNTHPLWNYMKEQKGEPGLAAFLGKDIKWNFAKFLIGRDGTVLSRYPPTTSPDEIEPDIIKALNTPLKGVVTPTGATAATDAAAAA